MSTAPRRPERPPHPSDLLTLDEVLAELRGVARSTFFRWKAIGRAPRTIKLPNGDIMVRRRDLDAWLDSRAEVAA